MLKSLYSRQYQTLLELLRAARGTAGLRQAELAARIGWNQADVSKVENGVRRLDVIELKLWLAALDMDLVPFLTELEAITQSQPSFDPTPKD